MSDTEQAATSAVVECIYVTVAGTDADPGKIAEAIRQRIRQLPRDIA